jgi:hypothetical protein
VVSAALWPRPAPAPPERDGRAGAHAAAGLVAVGRDRRRAGRRGSPSRRAALTTARVYRWRDWAGGAAREETGCVVRTDREQGRPPTALSRRHARRLDQECGGKRPTRLDGGLRRLRRPPASALSPGAARRDERQRVTSAPTEKVASSCVRERFAQRQQTTAIWGGGGLNQYHAHGTDVLPLPSSVRFMPGRSAV